jgi:hypothetical protein
MRRTMLRTSSVQPRWATELFADFGCTFYFEFNYANPTICA